jgi:hypothetical protein
MVSSVPMPQLCVGKILNKMNDGNPDLIDIDVTYVSRNDRRHIEGTDKTGSWNDPGDLLRTDEYLEYSEQPNVRERR